MSDVLHYVVLNINRGPDAISLLGDRQYKGPVLPVLNGSEYEIRRARHAELSRKSKEKQKKARIKAELASTVLAAAWTRRCGCGRRASDGLMTCAKHKGTRR